MKFRRKLNEYFATSSCGKYKIAECKMKGKIKYISYQGSRILGSSYDKQKAIKLCEGNLKK